jgi:hypothetical protein
MTQSVTFPFQPWVIMVTPAPCAIGAAENMNAAIPRTMFLLDFTDVGLSLKLANFHHPLLIAGPFKTFNAYRNQPIQ